MPRLKTNVEFLNELYNLRDDVTPLEQYINNSTKIKCKCNIHNLIFETTPKRILSNRKSCSKCIFEEKSKRLVKTNEQFLQELKDKDIKVIPLEPYTNQRTEILCRCVCGLEWKTLPERILKGCLCKECGYKKFSGEKNHFYNHNLTEEDRQDPNRRMRNPNYSNFVDSCFKRDNYTCRITNKKSSGDIVVHHINGYNWDIQNRTNIDNGITLNIEIHKEFHKLYGKGNNTKEQFIEFLDLLQKQNRIEIEQYENILLQIRKIK